MVAEAVRGNVIAPPATIPESAAGVEGRDSARVERSTPVLSPARRFARLNALIALLTFADGVLESFIYDDFSLVGFSAVFVAPFLWFAWSLSRSHGLETARWLRISGWSCLALAATCVFSGIGAVTQTPVDVACVVMSAAFLAIMGGAGLGQLRAGRE
jgi:hypothetical protein